MNERDFNGVLAKVWRILKETKEISTEELFNRVSALHSKFNRERLAFILGWLAREQKISLEMKEDKVVIVEQASKYEFAFG